MVCLWRLPGNAVHGSHERRRDKIFGHVKTRRCRNRQSKWTVRCLSIYIYIYINMYIYVYGQITDEIVGPRRWGKHIYIQYIYIYIYTCFWMVWICLNKFLSIAFYKRSTTNRGLPLSLAQGTSKDHTRTTGKYEGKPWVGRTSWHTKYSESKLATTHSPLAKFVYVTLSQKRNQKSHRSSTGSRGIF